MVLHVKSSLEKSSGVLPIKAHYSCGVILRIVPQLYGFFQNMIHVDQIPARAEAFVQTRPTRSNANAKTTIMAQSAQVS